MPQPETTADPHTMLNNLWLSVSRGGEVFTADAQVVPREGKNDFMCRFYLQPGGVTPEVRKPLEKYMRGFALANGWKLTSVRFKKGYAELVMARSRAASRASRNL